jgi:hypothetical protein
MDKDTFKFEKAKPVGGGTHVVNQGECIYSLAARSGHDWKTIWEHPQNAVLKATRQDPGVLLPGDRVHIPEIKLKTIDLPSGGRHRVVVMGQNIALHLRMCDADGEPIAGAKYQIAIGSRRIPVTTNGDGRIEALIPASALEAKLRNLHTGEIYSLNLGHMDPPDTASAIRKRLANLGYNLDAADGDLNEHALSVLRAFCEDADLGWETEPEDVMQKLQEKDPWRS